MRRQLCRCTLLRSAMLAMPAVLGAQSPSQCSPVDPRAAQLLQEIVAAVNEGSAPVLLRLTRTHWPQGNPATLDALGMWHWRSRHLAVIATCGAALAGRSYALVANALSEETDSLMIEVDSTTQRIRTLAIRGGARVPIPPVRSAADIVSEVTRLAQRLADADVFSGEILLATNGRILLHETFGHADPEKQQRIPLGQQYSNASIGKLFTATAILQLVEQGRLHLSDTLGALVPGWRKPRGVESITIQQLLSHTSGIDPQSDTLGFPPGTRYQYSNYGFNVLSDSILTRIVGRHFAEHYATAVFGPAGMRRTIRLVTETPLADMLPAYWVRFDSAGLQRSLNPMLQTIPAMGAGNWFTTAEDLWLFAEALRNGRLVSSTTLANMRREHTPGGLYGLGVMLSRGQGVWGHAGDLPGTDADLELYGDTGYVAVILANRSGVNDPVRRRIAALVRATASPGS